jgi:hypothetical protein
MTTSEYPALASLVGGLFHQDFDLVGHTVAEIMSAFRAVTPRAEQAILATNRAACVPDDIFEATPQSEAV